MISRLDEDSEVFRAARKGGGWQAAGLCQVVKVPSVMGMCRWLPTDAPMMVQHGKGTMRLADMTDALEAQ